MLHVITIMAPGKHECSVHAQFVGASESSTVKKFKDWFTKLYGTLAKTMPPISTAKDVIAFVESESIFYSVDYRIHNL